MQFTGSSLHNSIESLPAGEDKLYEVRKHPVGIILLYVEALLGLGVALGLMFFLVPQFLSEGSQGDFNSIMALIAVVAVGLTLLMLFVASVVYRQSYIIITSKNVTQVLQQGLFKRKVSELALGNIEDVTAEQTGIIQTLFNYGTMHVETAGEADNFEFSFCPKPNYCGKMLLEARQRYIESDPMRAKLSNNRMDVPMGQPAQPSQPMPTYQVPPTPQQPAPPAPMPGPAPAPTPEPPAPMPPPQPPVA